LGFFDYFTGSSQAHFAPGAIPLRSRFERRRV
jgi:hypothetical protein